MFNMREKGILEYDRIVDLCRSHHDATLIKPGSPALYQLNTERTNIDGTDRKVRRWTFGRRDRNKQNKVILLVGETGAGKTTMINLMINYLLGVKFEDEEFYQITEEGEHVDQTQSQTSEITVYEVFVEENPTSLTIINTPGYGHTEGYEKDREISEYLIRLFSDEDGIHYIDAVCFVMKASQNRLSGKELYIFHSVLSLFGRDIENNIVFLLTHSDGGPPTDALNVINTAEVPRRRDEENQPIHFLFNNRQTEERDEVYEHTYRSSWEMGERSMNEFFTLLEEINRKSVQMTLEVSKERKQREACVFNLKEQISEKELKIKELTEIQEALRQNRDKIQKCENFQFTIRVECRVMKHNHCTVCPGKCHYSKHVRENKKYVTITKTVIMTFDELKQAYECTRDENVNAIYENTKKEHGSILKESENKAQIEDKLNSDLEKIKTEKSKLLYEAYMSIMSLCKITLKADSAFTLQHLDFLIPRLKEEGRHEWMKNLEDLKKAGEQQKNKGALQHVIDFTGQKWNRLASFK
ncbi:Immune-associated nucleotide-binding protein 13 [Labeo rohita]|uniref:Immune-associated nucleotide-binding protein 13 n=1 Tax=Labeo rohita TaxID=84645 RepID=A0ABQ8MML4_LABRO|nr:Immune-associated nucleotide-binding protein 13 [Labeo rohita]